MILFLRVKLVKTLFVILYLGVVLKCSSEQRVDPNYYPRLLNPATFQKNNGPIVLIDEGHNNIVATKGRYTPFIEVLRLDGYIVKSLGSPFTVEILEKGDILVIGNALHDRNVRDWSLPTPSAFTEKEITEVCYWIKEGGALLLLADHMPCPGAAKDLAQALGFDFTNSFVFDPETWDPTVFCISDSTLSDHPIVRGRSKNESIDSVASFFGQAFRSDEAQPLLVIGPSNIAYLPDKAWEFNEETPSFPAEGWLQGAVRKFGKGRVAVFGEATMFSAQIDPSGKEKLGMNTPEGKENLQFLLNIFHWLSGLIKD